MKKLNLCLLFLLSFSLQVQSEVYNLKKKNTNPKTQYEKLYRIELIEGLPRARNYEKLEPLWSKADKLEDAIADIKRSAANMGADAIIELETGIENNDTSVVTILGSVSTGTKRFYAKGWAVKWKGLSPE